MAGSRASAFATSSCAAAMELGLSGWVANELDGSVRCVAEGPRDDLEALLEIDGARTGRRTRRAGQRDVEPRDGRDLRDVPASGSRRSSGADLTRMLTRSRLEWDRWAIPRGTIVRHRLRRWSQTLPPRIYPTLYRAILDRVADLEAAGDRGEARLVRQRRHGSLFASMGRPGPASARSAASARRATDRRRARKLGRGSDAILGRGDRRSPAAHRAAERRTVPGAGRPRGRTLRTMASATRRRGDRSRASTAYDAAGRARRGGRGRVVVRQRPVARLARAPRRGRRGRGTSAPWTAAVDAAIDRLDRRGRPDHRPAPRDRLAVDLPAGRAARPRRDAMRFQDAARDGRAGRVRGDPGRPARRPSGGAARRRDRRRSGCWRAP